MKELLLLTLALAACAGLVFWLTQREIAKVLECAEDAPAKSAKTTDEWDVFADE